MPDTTYERPGAVAERINSVWEARIDQLLQDRAAMMTSILHAPKPIIACVQGIASAAGCQLVSACDLAIASEDATFCTPGGQHWHLLHHAVSGYRSESLEKARTGNGADR